MEITLTQVPVQKILVGCTHYIQRHGVLIISFLVVMWQVIGSP